MLTMITNLEVGPPDEKPTIQRTNFDFNSFIEMDGSIFSLSEDGFFILGGNDDDGVDIDAYFELPASMFGIPSPKRTEFFYVDLESDGDVKVTVTPNNETSRAYSETISPETTEFHRHSEKMGEGEEFLQCTVRFENVDGSDFTLHQMSMLFAIMNQRQNRY